MSQHAPGPWDTPRGLALSRHKAGKPIDCEIPITAGDRPIAFASYYCAEEGITARITERNRMVMQEANARLIAAAPELLEALKKLTASHASFFGIEAALQEARAAIRKAEEGNA